jgi:hypothetical protein
MGCLWDGVVKLMRRENLVLLLLFIGAWAIRSVGVDYGYFHGDERMNDAAKAMTGQLIPGQHFYPPLLNYINAVGFAGLFAVGKGLSWWQSAGDFRAQYFDDPTIFYITARFLTGAMGALIAPLAFVIARGLKQSVARAAIVGVMVGITPLGVYFSFIAKGDVPLATATILIVLVFLQRMRVPASMRLDVMLGLVVVIGLSFKHSLVFFLVPLLIAHGALLLPQTGGRGYLRALGTSLLTILVTWPVLNIGIVLDFENFITFQKIQAVMSVQEDASLWQAMGLWLDRATHLQWGINGVMVIAFLLLPVLLMSGASRLPQRRALMALWLVTGVGILLLAAVVRLRQPEHLWISFFMVMQLLAALALVDLAGHARRAVSGIAWGALGISAALSIYALVLLWGQTLAAPVTQDISRIISQEYADRKVLTGVVLDIPKTMAAQAFEFARLDGLAAKYDVQMPERAPERTIQTDVTGSVFHIPMPGVMFGLEDATDEELKGKVKPYAWPLQKQEWQVKHWVAQGFDVIVVSHLEYLINETPSATFRKFYASLAQTCTAAHVIAPRKPLFLEREVIIFDCANVN